MTSSFSFQGILIWLICAVFFLYEFLLRTIVGTFQHPIMYELDLNAVEFSFLSSTIYLLIYAVMQIPVGLIVDRIGLKNSLLIGCVICAFSSIGFAQTHSYPIASLFRFLTGFGSAFGFICLLVSVYEWLPASKRSFLIGMSLFIGTMGPMIAAGPVEAMAESGDLNWRSVFHTLGIFGFGLCVLIFFFVKNNSEKTGKHVILKRPESIGKTLKHLFSKPQVLWVCSLTALTYFSLEYLSENDGKLFLISKGIDALDASFMLSLSWFGYAIACPLMGWFSDYTQRRKPTFILVSFITTLSLSVIVFSFEDYILRIAFFMLGVGASGSTIGYAAMSEQFKKPYLAAGLSLNNAALTGIAAINAPILGYILDSLKIEDIPSAQTYMTTFTVMIVMVGIAIPVALFLFKETYCKSSADYTYLSRK